MPLTQKTIEVPSAISHHDLTTEAWREYEWPHEHGMQCYRISEPVALFIRTGGSTHRVLDKNNVVHCLPAPGQFGCVLRWQNKDTNRPCEF